MDRNQKKSPVLAPARRADIGKTFLREARRSREICLLLAKALLRPEPFFPPQPNLPVGELLTMLRLALLAPIDLGQVRTTEEREEWYDYARNLSLWCLSHRLLMPKDVSRARRVLRAFQPFMPKEAFAQANANLYVLEKKYAERIKVLTAAQSNREMKLATAAELLKLRKPPRPRRRGGRPVTPGGGRAISEHQQRIVAVAVLLEDCGEQNPEKIIVSLLKEQNVSTTSTKVKRTIATYKDAARSRRRTDAFIAPENLPEFWVERLGWFYQFWKSMTQRVAGARVDGSPQVLLAAFVEEFLKAASFAVTCPPWRSPAVPRSFPTFLWREGRSDKPRGPGSHSVDHPSTH
jgi:hypothetical protein